MQVYLKKILSNIPQDWINLTTHRLDIYHEELAKKEFIAAFEELYHNDISDTHSLSQLPTAFDYIRLGHPLSCILEWSIAQIHQIANEQVISFSSESTPLLAVLRKNLMLGKKTRILYQDALPKNFDEDILKSVYAYDFELQQISSTEAIADFDGSTLYFSKSDQVAFPNLNPQIDFYLNAYSGYGSILLVNGESNRAYIDEIQHVRRRETIAMTPANAYAVLHSIAKQEKLKAANLVNEQDKASVIKAIQSITQAKSPALIGSSGLSIQYCIMMGLVHHAKENHSDKAIKIIVPPNCYGGTNDQARRVADCIPNVSIMDLPVDGDNDMVQSVEKVLSEVAAMDAVPFIIAEIPTNPRVEVPDMKALQAALAKERKTASGQAAIAPVFILDQTFCPNVHFLGTGESLATVQTIAYVSGSKFPSGGKCTAGYVVANEKAQHLMQKLALHLQLCDNEATPLQIKLLAEQLPSMNERIAKAYTNTREFVNFIQATLPSAKINFVSEELAAATFTPSVFSLDLPSKGNTPEEKEEHKRKLNHQLIQMMISEIPSESKYCVSYGQLKGCYWTIPATSTQGTTKEGDKDYIVRVALSPHLDLEKHKEVFARFVEGMG